MGQGGQATRVVRLWPVLLLASVAGFAQDFALPARRADARSGSEIVQRLAYLGLAEREAVILGQARAGNVPDFYRRFCPVTLTNVTEGRTNWAVLEVAPDYFAIGSDADYFLTPLSPGAAQQLADVLGCTLPTRKLVNAIYAAAAVKLSPVPMTPGERMTTVAAFAEHNIAVRTQRVAQLPAHPSGALVAGHKKDVVISARLTNAPGKVAIYGWHKAGGLPIQPLYLGHTDKWVDYSHGIRFVRQRMVVNGESRTVAEVLADPELCGLLSDEGVVPESRYVAPATNGPGSLSGFTPTGGFGEMTNTFAFAPEVTIHLNAPLQLKESTNQPVLLVLYALPNGNTIEQTVGRQLRPGDDWHFDIQHIGAQTRWLRERMPDRAIVVAYLEAAMKSWPAWRRTNGNARIPGLVEQVKALFAPRPVEIVLTGHSGGGSFTFGLIEEVTALPADVKRIAFLDSNYAYATQKHLAKFTNWLNSAADRRLGVFAYHDNIALLEGKTFVSASGGTWGRSHAMLDDLKPLFEFTRTQRGNLEVASALSGRLQFLLLENPERKVLHTVQVERNGFIHALLFGTPVAEQGYAYMGERVYSSFIAAPP